MDWQSASESLLKEFKMWDDVADYLKKPHEVLNHSYDINKYGEKGIKEIYNKNKFVGNCFWA